MSTVTTKRVSAPLDFTGKVEFLHLCPSAFLPMRLVASLTLLPGQDIDGDRYCLSGGFYSHKPEEGRQVTLFEIETLEALKRDHQIDFGPQEHRRNITVRGVPLNHLVGRRFWVGDTLLEATRLSTPCKHLEEITGKPVFNPLINRSGLNCKIVQGGKVYVNDLIRPYQANESDYYCYNRDYRAGDDVLLITLADPDRWELL